MSRAGRFLARLVLAGAATAGAYFAWVSSVGSPAPVELLPPGPFVVVDVRGAGSLARQLEGTRFAAAAARSATGQWLERTEAVRTFDAVLAEVGRVSGVPLGRGSVLDLLGAEAAVGWYPRRGGADGAPWVAGGRLSLRAWLAAAALRLARSFGLGARSVARAEAGGRVLYSFPVGGGQSLHVFLAGRVLVGGPDRPLVEQAARAGGEGPVTREPAWQKIRGALPPDGELFVWLRDRAAIPGAVLPGTVGRGSVGTLLRAGRTVQLDVAAERAAARPAATPSGGDPPPLPGVALLRQAPLLFLSSREPLPSALADLLQDRASAVARRTAGTTSTALRPGSGYAAVVTGSAEASRLFPAPRGLVMIGMADAAEASRALPLLFPPGARRAAGGGTLALASRESFPLAGEFELWGAAIGRQLVFATGTSLIDDAAGAGPGTAPPAGDPSWRVDTLATLSVERLLPLLRRWSPPLSGLLAARWPEAPDVSRDLGLLAAVGTVRVAAGSDGRFDRAAVTFDVHDLR